MEFEWLKKVCSRLDWNREKPGGAAVSQMDQFITDWEQTKHFASQGSFPGGLPVMLVWQ